MVSVRAQSVAGATAWEQAVAAASGGRKWSSKLGERPDRPESIKTLRRAAAIFFRFPSPRFLLIHLLALLGLRLAVGNFSLWDLAVVGLVSVYWPFQEWLLHVKILHSRPFQLMGRTIDLLPARLHREHHRDPWYLPHIFLPLRVVAGLAPFSALLWWLAMPNLGLALTGMAALGAAALLYEWVHYLTHTHYRPRGAYYRKIWKGHRLHHFKNEKYWHAFTVPLVDNMMGTAPDPREVETSETCRDLDASK